MSPALPLDNLFRSHPPLLTQVSKTMNIRVPDRRLKAAGAAQVPPFKIVRVHYFVRGGFAGNRSRASSKHLSPHLPVDGARFLGGQKGFCCTCKLHVWLSGLQRNRPDVDVFEK
ncbi:hypothetical protein TNCV_398251 [Trichonephila clavipes]|nr:hypothetical protein TNCV_398251 [Trichonephila clavipes]